jgi:hypothetical protein
MAEEKFKKAMEENRRSEEKLREKLREDAQEAPRRSLQKK